MWRTHSRDQGEPTIGLWLRTDILDERYAALSVAGDPLEKLGGLIDFEYSGLHSMRPCSVLMVAGAVARRWTQS